MTKIILFGNSGSGKSTLAKKIAVTEKCAHLDLDSIAWLPQEAMRSAPGQAKLPQRMSLADSEKCLDEFTSKHSSWVIEGCYADLIELVLPLASEIIYLNLSIEECVNNAKARPWEPDKYASKQEQDANLDMLIGWIKEYETRDDMFSKNSHFRLYKAFEGTKRMITKNEP